MTLEQTAWEQKVRRGLTVALVLLLLAWVVIGFMVGPYIVKQAHAGTGFDYITKMMKNRLNHSADYYNWYWYRFMGIAGASLVGLYVFGMLLSSKKFFERCIGKATPLQLGGIRMIVAAILLTSILWEDVPSSAALPRSMFHGVGFMSLVMQMPGFETILASESLLGLLDYCTIITLCLAMVGLFSRITVPLGALLYLVMVGILRSYAWPYHTGILPMYVLFVLALTPCADAWSLDRLWKIYRGKTVPPPDVATAYYGWARYAAWSVVAIAYAAAGLSKMRNGGWGWFHPNNFRQNMIGNSLQPMEFDFTFSMQMESAPDWVFVAIATGSLIMQLSCLLLLFSKLARNIMPLLIIGMHFGIWMSMNILFFDVLLLPLIYYNYDPILKRISHYISQRTRPGNIVSQEPSLVWWGPVRVFGIAVLLLSVWVMKFEFYPLTSMQMFSRPTTESLIIYYKAISHHADGSQQRAPLEKSIGAMADSRYRAILKKSFREKSQPLCRDFFKAVADRYQPAENESPIVSFEVQKWEWDSETPSQQGVYGAMVANRIFKVEVEKKLQARSASNAN